MNMNPEYHRSWNRVVDVDRACDGDARASQLWMPSSIAIAVACGP